MSWRRAACAAAFGAGPWASLCKSHDVESTRRYFSGVASEPLTTPLSPSAVDSSNLGKASWSPSDVPLPWDKLACHLSHPGVASGGTLMNPHRQPWHAAGKVLTKEESSAGLSSSRRPQVVLVLAGSFNPPTYMHLRMLELAKDAMEAQGWDVLGAYMSPVNDSYGKKGLASGEHRVRMCQLATEDSPFIMVDPWEASQSQFQRTLKVLQRIDNILNSVEGATQGNSAAVLAPLGPLSPSKPWASQLRPAPSSKERGNPEASESTGNAAYGNLQQGRGDDFSGAAPERVHVALVCGADLLKSITTPGVWVPEQVDSILREYGLVCISREGDDARAIVFASEVLYQHKENIMLVDNHIYNSISSSKIRAHIARGLSVKYLLPEAVIMYIHQHNMYPCSRST